MLDASSRRDPIMPKHPSHETRISDASTFDEICVNCGATDITAGGWGQLEYPCSKAKSIEEPVIKTLHETELEKLKRENEIFKRAFHYIQLHASVTMNHERVMIMINAICDWSYSHRCGNGENSEERQNELIESSFKKIEKIVNRDVS